MSNIGIDETQPALPFVRLVAPTDIQQVAAELSRIIKDYYPGFDLLNPDLWRKLGFSTLEGPLIDFLQRLVQVERERGDSLTASNISSYYVAMKDRYGYSTEDLNDYLRAFTEAAAAGLVPDTILKPYSYTPTTAAEDVAQTVSRTVIPTLGPLLLGALAIYAAVTVLLPKLILRKT